MNKWPILPAVFVVVAQIFASHPLSATTPDNPVTSAKTLLEAKLLEPLHKKEADRSRFSRAALPPQARRIRILNNDPQTDDKGHPFIQFSIDETRAYKGDQEIAEAGWFKDAITGCVYPETGEVMIRRGNVYYPSSVLLGQTTPMAPPGVCRAY